MESSFIIHTAYPRGYCAWVHRAVDMLIQVISTYPDEQIYVNHEIIHNRYAIAMFERKWVIFESDIAKIPKDALIVISAHGIGPSYFSSLRARGIRWVDATCPLVEKVHREARDLISKWYHILYIGKKGHQEAVWVIDEGEKYFTLIEKEEDLKGVSDHWLQIAESTISNLSSRISHPPLALLTQTTLSVHDTEILIEKIQQKFPSIVLPNSWDICYATTNRQKAVKALAAECDIILVIGSQSSSNSTKLRDVAEKFWSKAYLIDDASEIETDWLIWVSSVWVTAWASGPEELVQGVVAYLEKIGWKFAHELRVMEEKVTFPYTLKIQN